MYDRALVQFAADASEDPLGEAVRDRLRGELGTTFAGAARVRAGEQMDHERPDWSRTIADVVMDNDDDYIASVVSWANAAGTDLAAVCEQT